MLFSKQSAWRPAPRRHVRGICVFRALHTRWILSLMQPVGSPSPLVSFSACHPVRPLFRSSAFSSLRRVSLRQLIGQKTVLIWFPRLTFRAPGAWRTLSFTSASSVLFSPSFAVSSMCRSSTRPGKEARTLSFSLSILRTRCVMAAKKQHLQACFAKKTRAADEWSIYCNKDNRCTHFESMQLISHCDVLMVLSILFARILVFYICINLIEASNRNIHHDETYCCLMNIYIN